MPTPPARTVTRALLRRIPSSSSQAIVLSGVRRSGKSTLLAQLLRRAGSATLINFEDTRLYGLEPADFPTLLSLIDQGGGGGGIIGLDEVQVVPEWQRLVRTLLDRGRGICLTGSNASLLGREMGARLTGRHLSFEVLPFSYPEYLAHEEREANEASLRSYLEDGGFPTFLRERSDAILRELLVDVIHRDIAARHGLREIRHVMNLALFLLTNTGQQTSLHRLAKTLAIPTVAQASRYVEYLDDAYLLLSMPKLSQSSKQRVVSPRKYYAVDLGLRRANSPQAAPDLGRRLENAVYLALRPHGAGLSWAGESDLWECDFVTERAAIQVTLELTEANRVRELGGLVKAQGLPPRKRRALVVTLDQTDRLKVDGIGIDVVPAWRWLAGAGPG